MMRLFIQIINLINNCPHVIERVINNEGNEVFQACMCEVELQRERSDGIVFL